jgi:hypothetical protein
MLACSAFALTVTGMTIWQQEDEEAVPTEQERQENARVTALTRMRALAVAARRDSLSWTGTPLCGQNAKRMTLFCEAAADLSGRTLEAELASARGEEDPPWSQSPRPLTVAVPSRADAPVAEH